MKRFFCIFLSFAMIISAVFALPMFSTAASTDEPTATDVPTATIAPTPTSEPSATDEPEATPVPVTVEDAFADVSTLRLWKPKQVPCCISGMPIRVLSLQAQQKL